MKNQITINFKNLENGANESKVTTSKKAALNFIKGNVWVTGFQIEFANGNRAGGSGLNPHADLYEILKRKGA